mmetsp:Transcript_26792/g.41008  ORF Transcript_26792/g.41008 Transcript_26792/m.41008 type:complete len:97 (-) Transcript_26792:48-338(-)
MAAFLLTLGGVGRLSFCGMVETMWISTSLLMKKTSNRPLHLKKISALPSLAFRPCFVTNTQEEWEGSYPSKRTLKSMKNHIGPKLDRTYGCTLFST